MTFAFLALGFGAGCILLSELLKWRFKRRYPNNITFGKEIPPGHAHAWTEIGAVDPDTRALSMHQVCTDCGFVSGTDGGFLTDGQLAEVRTKIRVLEEVQLAKTSLAAELVAKHFPAADHLHELGVVGKAAALAEEAVQRGMTLTRDMAVDKLKKLSEGMKSGSK